MENRLFEYNLAIILLTMECYLELKQYKWIIMLMAQFGFKIWWQAVFLEDHCSWITVALTQVLCVCGLVCSYHLTGDVRCFVLRPHSNMCVCVRVCMYSSDTTSFASHTNKHGF